ncbi:unnamed protein product [Notodromas monacha]|uniref:Methyltransferase FkbM domain-containing protein n=1 Tax=Notodromas monacha TaxID=399045 RepID=A0A7R9BY17_9CRUS|nr:unnamed protein product [Notodromas monacha]CAG0923778.1 unnamed protein product [Notodromas monacha]
MRKFAAVTIVVVVSFRFVAQLMTSVCLNDDTNNQSLVLLDDQQKNHYAWDECVIRLRSIESPNADALKHPKLLDHIRKKVIIDLGERRGRTRIPVDGADEDPSTGQFMSRLIVPKFFLNSSVKYEGKFFEAGALDGKFASTTYFLERKLGWSGLLAEANPLKHQEIINSSERRALFAAACLSPETKPCHGTFGVAHLESGPVPNDVYWYGKLLSGSGLRKTRRVDPGWRVFTARVTCFPLYSLLVAANLTRIDFLSLDSSVKYEGKFFEAGALDGKFASTTYFLERKLGWSGLLAEANPLKHQEIINSSERRALFAAACLSPETKPCHGTFGVAHLESGPVPNDVYWYGKLLSGSGLRKTRRVDPGWRVFTARVTCFPLYSLLVAANLTRIDFLSLDVESIEPHVLKTLPWEEDDFEAKVIRLDLHAGRIYARYKQFAIDFLQSKGYHFHKELLENPFVGINDVHVFSKRGYFV